MSIILRATVAVRSAHVRCNTMPVGPEAIVIITFVSCRGDRKSPAVCLGLSMTQWAKASTPSSSIGPGF